MFCVVQVVKNNEEPKEYLIGSDIEICLNGLSSFRIKGKLKEIKKNGMLIISQYGVFSRGEYINMDGMIEVGVYEIKDYTVINGKVKKHDLTLLYK